ncbi:MAG TPA: pirin family protein [Casimicrobiaceae bacterium]|jgi:redox-sensitive bicupin YhaK (pirin superfamily)|nr:pirin family protein [Casimicrobiaceae bacterium]
MIEKRAAGERGLAEHGWLTSFHSFSFADYHDPRHMGFGPLRVINEDRVAPGTGFGTHGHRDMEILSYVLDGELAHRDDMGNGSTIRPGDVQRMSAGRGVRHSENNPSRDRRVHFLQIWIEPDTRGVDPGYEQKHVPDADKRGRFALIAGPAGSGAAVSIHQDARLYAALVDGDEAVTHDLAPGRRAYVHVARGRASVNGIGVHAGDALKLTGEKAVRIDRGEAAEVLLFDLP